MAHTPSPTKAPNDFRAVLADPAATRLWLGGLGIRDVERAVRDIRDLSSRAADASLMSRLALHLDILLPRCPDPGMALTNLERFISGCAEPPDSRPPRRQRSYRRNRSSALQH